MFLIRLDDASEYMDVEKWSKMEKILDEHGIKPIYGIIPANEDPDLLKYGRSEGFWDKMRQWQSKGWTPALHGYCHVFETDNGGINPVNRKSEFAGVSFERQCQKIKDGIRILKSNGIHPEIFFAPAHTFDQNTIKALKKESDIKVISDTVACDTYYQDGIYFIPQQSGKCRKLPFKIVTFCYHPNIMVDTDFGDFEEFVKENKSDFISVNQISFRKKSISIIDKILKLLYFARRKKHKG